MKRLPAFSQEEAPFLPGALETLRLEPLDLVLLLIECCLRKWAASAPLSNAVGAAGESPRSRRRTGEGRRRPRRGSGRDSRAVWLARARAEERAGFTPGRRRRSE